ncbi:MAG: hypothetical protein NTY77_05665 [Elusimicrobia bacterium]|nr:hypothetical protein [Elusimicrobiota bacterium]
MRKIDNVSNDPHQVIQLVLDDGTVATVTLDYNPMTQRWVFSIEHPRIPSPANAIYGLGVSCNPNLLRQWRSILGFGLGCMTTDKVADPVNQQDFANGRAALYVLEAADVEQVEQTIFGVAV